MEMFSAWDPEREMKPVVLGPKLPNVLLLIVAVTSLFHCAGFTSGCKYFHSRFRLVKQLLFY